MDVRLKVTTGKYAGKEIPLANPEFMIGRGDDCQLRTGSDLVSRHHCRIAVSDSAVHVRDCGSRNGTFVNDERIETEVELKAGDLLRVGPLDFEVLIAAPAADTPGKIGGKKRPAVKDLADVAARTAAPGEAASVEDSISDWLGPPTVAGAATSAVDTQALRVGDTETIEPSPSEEQLADTKADAESDDSEKDEKKPKKPEPGKLPKVEGPKTKDSREAAANILRQMAMRRR